MKSHKKEIIIIAVLMAALLVIFTGLLTPEATQTQECSMIYIPKIKDDANDFWTELISGCQMAAEEYNSELEIMAPAKEEDIEEQNQLLREAIEKKPDAILFSPSSMSASDELLKEAKDQGIRFTYIDSYTVEEIQDLTVATDNVEAGRMLGKYARTLLNKDSKIAIVSHVKGVSTAVEREQGFREGLGDYADNIVDVVYCNSLYEKSYELTNELMEKYPDLELIAGMNEYSAVGVGRAVCDAQAKDQIGIQNNIGHRSRQLGGHTKDRFSCRSQQTLKEKLCKQSKRKDHYRAEILNSHGHDLLIRTACLTGIKRSHHGKSKDQE